MDTSQIYLKKMIILIWLWLAYDALGGELSRSEYCKSVPCQPEQRFTIVCAIDLSTSAKHEMNLCDFNLENCLSNKWNFLEVGKCDRKIVRTQARERGLVAERHLEDPEIESRDNIPIFRAFDKKTQPPKSVEKKVSGSVIPIHHIADEKPRSDIDMESFQRNCKVAFCENIKWKVCAVNKFTAKYREMTICEFQLINCFERAEWIASSLGGCLVFRRVATDIGNI